MEWIANFLKQKETESSLRKLYPVSFRKDGKIRRCGKEYIDFSSNDYLGLAGHPKIAEAAKKALDEFGTGACASRLLSGDFDLHHVLEDRIAKLKNKESALVFNTGYQANLAIISSIYARSDAIFSDRLNHASIVDGILLSGARHFRFKHNDAEHLKMLLEKERNKFKKALVVTESVFSMDGDRAPLKELVELKRRHDCQLMVDEAHATGIYGQEGSGVIEEEGLSQDVDLVMGTFSKALGGFGSYIASSRKVAQYLINTARGFIYSTALPPAIIAANIASLKILKDEPHRRHELLQKVSYFRGALRNKGFEARGSSQIVPLIIGESKKAIEFAESLQEKGYWVMPIRPPTVPSAQARLRFSLSFNHDTQVLQRLINDIPEI